MKSPAPTAASEAATRSQVNAEFLIAVALIFVFYTVTTIVIGHRADEIEKLINSRCTPGESK